MAFAQTFEDNGAEFNKWLLENGYPELSALSEAIRGSERATKWLMDNKFYHLAALDAAIDNKTAAFQWLQRYDYKIRVLLVEAVHGNQSAINILTTNNLDIFLIIAQKIRKYLDNKTFDYHKMNF